MLGGLPEKAIMEKVLRFLRYGDESEEVYTLAFGCSMCGKCTDSCPMGIDVMRAMIKVRSEYFERGKVPEAILRGIREGEWVYLMRITQAMLYDPQELSRIFPPYRHAENVMFLGCTLSSYFPNYTLPMLDILENMKIDFTILAGGPTKDRRMVCCGFPLIQIGDLEMIERNAEGLISALKAFSPKNVIFPCAGCYRFFNEIYRKFLDIDFEVKYIYDFLLEHIDNIKFKKPIEKTVYLHSSCQGWGGRTNVSLQKFLERISGLRVILGEMNCCGGTPRVNIPEIYRRMSLSFRNNVAKGVINNHADYLSFQCQICNLAFSPVIVENKQPFEVKNPFELICEAMGIEKTYEDRWLKYWRCKSDEEIIEVSRKYFEANDMPEEEVRKAIPLIYSFR